MRPKAPVMNASYSILSLGQVWDWVKGPCCQMRAISFDCLAASHLFRHCLNCPIPFLMHWKHISTHGRTLISCLPLAFRFRQIKKKKRRKASILMVVGLLVCVGLVYLFGSVFLLPTPTTVIIGCTSATRRRSFYVSKVDRAAYSDFIYFCFLDFP